VRRTLDATAYVALSSAIGTISFIMLAITLAIGVPLLMR